MKKLLILPFLVASTFAGTEVSTKSPKAPIVPPPAPTLYDWFAGGTAGYLLDNEEGFYTGHVGVEWDGPGSCEQAVYLEVGWTEFDCSLSDCYSIDAELEIIPVSLNYKWEGDLTSSLRGYVGAGAGVAFMDLSSSGWGRGLDDDDTVFFAQVFAGVLYEVTESFELYAGGRLIWFDDPSFDSGYENDFDELGDWDCDWEEFDVLLEAGGRYTF